MEGCCAVEREVDRVLAKFNTTQQVMIGIYMLMDESESGISTEIFSELGEQYWGPDSTVGKASEGDLGVRGRRNHHFSLAGSPHFHFCFSSMLFLSQTPPSVFFIIYRLVANLFLRWLWLSKQRARWLTVSPKLPQNTGLFYCGVGKTIDECQYA